MILDEDVRFVTDDAGNRVEFVAYDSGPRDKNRIIIFCPKENIERLSKCDQGLSDGTFCVTQGFKQVNIQYVKHIFPSLHKTRQSYFANNL